MRAVAADLLLGVGVVLAGAGAVSTQVPLRETHQQVAFADDAYLLPPPEQLERLSLGHRAALADVMWADLLVSQGLRMGEKRRYNLVVETIDAINQLEPTWRDPYRLTQALVTLQLTAAPREEVLAVRRILERGVRERPNDAELYLILGAFVTYLAPTSYLEDEPELAAQWRKEGAEYLARAAELAPQDSAIVWQAIAGDRVLIENDQIERAVEVYQSILATTEDPELRARVEQKLSQLDATKELGARKIAIAQRRARGKEMARRIVGSYPAATINKARLMPFPRESSRCAGGARAVAAGTIECATSWKNFAEIDAYGGVTPDNP